MFPESGFSSPIISFTTVDLPAPLSPTKATEVPLSISKDISLRTSLIVGFPGETKEDFNELKEFIDQYRFNNLGVFSYSQEEGTPAAIMDNQIGESVKLEREKEIMEMQKMISKNLNKKNIGKTLDAIVEAEDDKYYIGRTKYMAPDIDGLVYILKENNSFKKGDIASISVVDALEYDLIGVVKNEFS